MKTIKTLKTIAAVMAVSFSAMSFASTYGIPGLPGFDAGKDNQALNSVGHVSITNMSGVIEKLGQTGGAEFTTSTYFQAFIGTDAKPYFDYVTAKPMIEELIYTVDGKTFHDSTDGVMTIEKTNSQTGVVTVLTFTQSEIGGVWSEVGGSNTLWDQQVQSGYVPANYSSAANVTGATVAAGYSEGDSTVTAIGNTVLWTSIESTLNNGKVVDGNIKESLAGGQAILSALGMQSPRTDINSDGWFVIDAGTETATVSSVLNAVTASGFALDDAAYASAKIVVKGYTNANALIRLIADQKQSDKFLDVIAAVQGINTIIGKHNSFLSANVLANARLLKAALKDAANQTAASALGQGARVACANQFFDGGFVDPACSAIGTKFTSFAGKITDASADDYNAALVQLEVFADNLIAFNISDAVTDFVALGVNQAAADITSTYGGITSDLDQTIFGEGGFGDAVVSDLEDENFDFELGTANGTGTVAK